MEKIENKITYEEIEKANKTIKPLVISRMNKETGKKEKKGYAEVHQRIKAFRMVYPQGDIDTTILTDENGICKIRCDVYDENNKHLATATAQENIKSNSFINKYNAIENCETSAVGRALGFAGFGVDKSIASAEEIKNAIDKQENMPMSEEQTFIIANLEPKYKESLRKFYGKDPLKMNYQEAEISINSLKAKGIEIKTIKEIQIEKKESEEVF